MKILITGATGFVGSALSQSLHESGHEIVVLTRNVEAAKKKLPFLAEAYPWDWKKGPPPLEAFQNVDGIVNLAGENIANRRWNDSAKKEIFDSRVYGTRHLISALKELGEKPKFLIHASAMGFYGACDGETLHETSHAGHGFLANLCKNWEESALEAETLGIRTVILRIGIILSLKGGMLPRIIPVFQKLFGGTLGSGQQWMSWVELNDLIGMFKFAIEKSQVSGVFNAIAPYPVTNHEFTKTLGNILGVPTLFRTPAFCLKLMLGEMASEVLLSSQSGSAQKIYHTGFRFKHHHLEDALKDILGKQ